MRPLIAILGIVFLFAGCFVTICIVVFDTHEWKQLWLAGFGIVLGATMFGWSLS